MNLLAIDIGNTSISYGWFRNEVLKRVWYGKSSLIPKIIAYLSKNGGNLSNYKVIISSVNPLKLAEIKKLTVRKIPLRNHLILGKEIMPNIRHKYNNINRLGKDRFTNIYGASSYPKPLLIINFGTAMTVDYLSKGGVYEGGMIIAGIETAWYGLQDRAALLPKIKGITDYKGLIGRSTEGCMRAGILQGFGAMVDGLIERFRSEYGRSLYVLASGGLAKKIRPYIKSKIKVDQTHTLRSLALIYKNYSKKNDVQT